MIDEKFEALVILGRAKWPKMATQLDEAYARVQTAIMTGDIDGGAAALADWIDARCMLAVYGDLPREPPPA